MKYQLLCSRREWMGLSSQFVFIEGTKASVRCCSEEVIQVGNRKQLLMDRRFITRAKGLRLVVNPPRKAGPVMLNDHPWEKRHIGSYVSVVEDQGLYKMWYMCHGQRGSWLCYATSTDGLRWERPALNLAEFENSRQNNIVLADFREGAVFLDPVAPPSQRYKTLAAASGNRPSPLRTTNTGTLMVLCSRDGIHWTEEFPVLPFFPDSNNCLFWDDRIQKYVAYLRGWNPLRVVVRVEIAKNQLLGSWPYTSSKNPNYLWRVFDFGRNWPATPSTEYPTVLAADEQDGPQCDVYTPNVQLYPWAADAYFAFPSMFRHTAPPGSEKVPMAGVLEVQLAVSREGIRFAREDRRPYISMGTPDEHDAYGAYMGLGMLKKGQEIFQYYGGVDARHSEPSKGGAIMLAVQRLDGFVSADTDSEPGEFTTPPIRFQGARLELNVDTSAMGMARVEIQDAEALAIPGFELRNCEAIVANEVARPVRWRESADVSALQGKSIRLRFSTRRAKLYAFQFL